MEHALQMVVLSGAAVAALGVLLKGTRASIRFMQRLGAAVHVVLYELTPNAGGSMKDAVQRIDRRVASLESWRESYEDRAS
jgi:hypothetical protein